MENQEKIVLIDGHSILNRAFYGIPMLTNAQGLHTNAVYGFLNILFKVLEEEKAQYAAVAFDLKAPTFRHKMYEAYKGTRKPMPQELHEQVPLMKEMLQAMQIPVMTLEGFEADDILGTTAFQMEREGLKVSIVSGDRDLLQLATDRICVRIPKTKAGKTEVEDYFAADVQERYQVTPQQFIDVKALMGDASDNIPGVPGIGEKTATKLIAQFGSLEGAYEHIEEVKPPRAREAMKLYQDQAEMSQTLAKINTDAPIHLSLDQARIETLYTPEAKQLCRKLELKNILSRFPAEETTQKGEVEQITGLAETEQLFLMLQGKPCGCRMITEEKTVFGAVLACAQGKEIKTWYLPAEGFVTAAYLADKIVWLLEKGSHLFTLHWKEQRFFVTVPPQVRSQITDLSVAAYLINPLKDSYESEDLAREYLNEFYPSRQELFGKLSLAKAQKEKPQEWLSWVGSQALIALQSGEAVRSRLREEGMEKLFEEIEMPLVDTLYEMEKEGILVEAEQLKNYGMQLAERITELEKEIWEEAEEPFNLNSPKQLGIILFEKLQLPHGKKTKTGYSTAAEVLEKLALEYPVVSKILEYRQLAKLKSTYADGLAGYIGEDGRIHGKFHQTITATGRISSTDPNLQNIPIRMEQGRLIRKVFVPKQGSIFLDADYSQIELRVLAHFSNDEKLIQAYREAQDIHSITASQVFHVDLKDVTPLLRRNAKAVNFGIVYGISSFGLSQDLSITRKEAQEYIEQYFRTYPGIKEFLDRTVEEARKNGYVTTLYGRRRPLPELQSSNFMQRSFGERVAMNAPIQGTAADIIKIAMNRVREALEKHHLKSRLILQVHDELLIETAVSEEEQVRSILEEEMKHAASLRVPLEIDMHSGSTWYDAK